MELSLQRFSYHWNSWITSKNKNFPYENDKNKRKKLVSASCVADCLTLVWATKLILKGLFRLLMMKYYHLLEITLLKQSTTSISWKHSSKDVKSNKIIIRKSTEMYQKIFHIAGPYINHIIKYGQFSLKNFQLYCNFCCLAIKTTLVKDKRTWRMRHAVSGNQYRPFQVLVWPINKNNAIKTYLKRKIAFNIQLRLEFYS